MLFFYIFIFLFFCGISFLAVLLCFCIVDVVKENYVLSSTALKLWLLAVPLLAAVLITLDFVWPDASRTYLSPDKGYRLRLTTYYSAMEIDIVRLKANLTCLESGETLAKITPRIRDVFVVGWPDSEWADKIISVKWLEEHQDIVRMVVTDMNTVYYLPSGKEIFPVPASSSPINSRIDRASHACRQRKEATGIRR